MKDIPTMRFVKNLKNGWNLGDTCDAINKNDTGSVDTSAHETAWGNPVTTPQMIELVKASGFDIFRIPVTWYRHIGEAPEYKIDEAWFNRISEIIDYGINSGLHVIVNLHHENWHFPSSENYERAADMMSKVWNQIANRFKDYDECLMFETMNEPRMYNTEYEWTGGTGESREIVNKFNEIALCAIRNTGGNNKIRKVLIPTYAANSEENTLSSLRLPDDKNIIVSVHAYIPYLFALSGEDKKDWSINNPSDTGVIDVLFDRLEKHFLSKGIPVILGETGARSRDNLSYRVEWTKYYTAKAREHYVPLVWWDNGRFTGSGENFGLMNRREVKWAFPEIVAELTK